MNRVRVGTRGSELALRQTRWVVERLRAVGSPLEFEEVVIRTHGDVQADQPIDVDFPPDGFVNALEMALLDKSIDFAVHSYKDLPTAETPGLVVAAVPSREAAHDVLIASKAVELANLPEGMRIGTSSPRRAAQLRRHADVTIIPIRGNVPTRIAKVQAGELDAVVLAAAGIRRLGLQLSHVVDLPLDRFVPAPGQGALAVQTRSGHSLVGILQTIEDHPSCRAVDAERSFLRHTSAGCHTPVGAYAVAEGDRIRLHGQLFTDDGERLLEVVEIGDDPAIVGRQAAECLLRERGS